MNIRNLYITFLIATLFTGVLIVLKVRYFNYLSLIYGFILYPIYIAKLLNLASKVSSYIKKVHPDFYEKHKTLTNSFEGKIVSLDKSEILKLNDKIVLDYYIEIRKLIALLFLTFLFIFLLSVLMILV
ncbi:hypothetical protein B8T70_21110 [Flavobacterium sp. AJR]|nr:hypothetical protein OA93_23810 [Flavobacterium sp. KMS]OUL60299.1 hypothetical protein B8T70_21110 [Flavobacterium sp. AJR]